MEDLGNQRFNEYLRDALLEWNTGWMSAVTGQSCRHCGGLLEGDWNGSDATICPSVAVRSITKEWFSFCFRPVGNVPWGSESYDATLGTTIIGRAGMAESAW
jgi:hypothetical protein